MQFHHFRPALYHIRLKSGRLRVMPEAHFHKDVDSRYPSLAIMIKSVSQSETKFDAITSEFQNMKYRFFCVKLNDLGIKSMLPDVKSTLDANSLDTLRKS